MSVSVTIKPIKGEPFKVEVDESAKVADLKQKIAEAKPTDFPVEAQKLIFTGKILQDETLVKDVGIKPDSFIVAMAAGVKPKAAPPASDAAAAAPAATPAAAAPADAGAAPQAAPATAPAEPGQLPAALTDLKSNPRWGELARIIASDPATLNRMLPALSRWPDVRNAIVQNVQGFVIMCRQEAGVHETTPMPQMAVGSPGGGGGMGRDQMMQALAQNPEMMEQLLGELPPEMQQMARENPEALMQMISQMAQAAGEGDMMPGMPGMGGGGGMPVPADLTEADNAAVDRLVALGFDKAQATQAYFACDKNEELAANFLFDGGA